MPKQRNKIEKWIYLPFAEGEIEGTRRVVAGFEGVVNGVGVGVAMNLHVLLSTTFLTRGRLLKFHAYT